MVEYEKFITETCQGSFFIFNFFYFSHSFNCRPRL